MLIHIISFPDMLMLAHSLVNLTVIFKYFHFQQNGTLTEKNVQEWNAFLIIN